MRAKADKPDWIEAAKKKAAQEAVRHVKDGFVVGLGSGSTAAFAVQEIGRKILQKNWHVHGVPTSYQAFLLAVDCGIPTTTLSEHRELDLTIDGADQIDPRLNMIKGMGGALAREKIVASASKLNVIVADQTKLVKRLAEHNHPVPVEVLPFAIGSVESKLKKMGAKPVIRAGKGKVGPVITDNGNFILDIWTEPIDNPKELDMTLRSIPGVVETGLFIGIANIVYVGTQKGVKKLSK